MAPTVTSFRYDGFAPARIPDRLLPSKILRLSWSRYMDSVELGDEVWIYFHGPHSFRPDGSDGTLYGTLFSNNGASPGVRRSRH